MVVADAPPPEWGALARAVVASSADGQGGQHELAVLDALEGDELGELCTEPRVRLLLRVFLHEDEAVLAQVRVWSSLSHPAHS
jgi:hypothetical protein